MGDRSRDAEVRIQMTATPANSCFRLICLAAAVQVVKLAQPVAPLHLQGGILMALLGATLPWALGPGLSCRWPAGIGFPGPRLHGTGALPSRRSLTPASLVRYAKLHLLYLRHPHVPISPWRTNESARSIGIRKE
jgi:hypothetical protein